MTSFCIRHNFVSICGVQNGVYNCPLEVQIIPFLCDWFKSNPYQCVLRPWLWVAPQSSDFTVLSLCYDAASSSTVRSRCRSLITGSTA